MSGYFVIPKRSIKSLIQNHSQNYDTYSAKFRNIQISPKTRKKNREIEENETEDTNRIQMQFWI